MKIALTFLMLIFSFLGHAASSCDVDEYLKTTDGKEKISGLIERSKTLALSKLEELGFDEGQIQFKVLTPKSVTDQQSALKITIQKKAMDVEGSKIELRQSVQDEDCGLEVKILGGRLIDKESGKDFGSLGLLKEFIRLN